MQLKSLLPICVAVLAAASGPVRAKLPPPTPEQTEAAAAKKAQAAADEEKQKRELAASMDEVTARWRTKAAANGWPVHPPTPVATQKALDAPAAQSSSSGQPGGRLGAAARAAPVRSEKSGTAPPSEDAKKTPTGGGPR